MTKVRQRALRQTLVTASACLSLVACAGNTPTTPVSATEQVVRLIGEARCSGDDDCATIGIGAMACGGPQAYAAWSKRQTDQQALNTAVARQREERERQIARSGDMSVCRVVVDPGARCSASGRCELRRPASGADAMR